MKSLTLFPCFQCLRGHMRRQPFVLMLSAVALVLSLAPQMTATSVTFFPNTVFSTTPGTLDNNVGITGDLIDTFQTTTLLPGLTITLSGGSLTTPITWTSLPAIFNGDTYPGGTGILTNQGWDGPETVDNATGNILNSPTTPTNITNLITFSLASGTTQFGIGLSNFQSDPSQNLLHELIINGVNFGVIETLAGSNYTSGFVRNTYLVINDPTGSITSVGFQNLNFPRQSQDFLMFDHLAIAASNVATAPEPATFWLLLTAGIPGGIRLLRRVR